MMKKRLISIILSVTMTVSVIPIIVHAENEEIPDYEALMAEEGLLNVPYADFDPEATQEPYSNESVEYEFEVPDDFEVPEIRDDIVSESNSGITTYATTSSNDKWETFMSDRFGDAYLAPYKKSSGQVVSGKTNRLTISETDLTLPGKNGLDVNIRRKHDNQYYSDIFEMILVDYYATAYNRRYVYAFTNSETNKTTYVGFMTHDDFYTYMENGLTVSEIPAKFKVVSNSDGVNVNCYYFENLYAKKSNSGITLTYDSSIEPFSTNMKYTESTKYEMNTVKLLDNRNQLGSNWTLDIPESGMCEDITTSTITTNNTWKTYDYDFTGAFRDIDGNIYRYTGVGEFKKYIKEDNSGTTNIYSAHFSSIDNDYLNFTPYLEMQTLSGTNQEYNFVIHDNSKGLDYYFYNKGVTPTKVSSVQNMYISAVKDRFGNTIQYLYDDTYGKLTGIIDTYGRTINITKDNGTHISYVNENNETKTISYTNETVAASELDNDSPIKGKEVSRFKVTNAEGEITIYDARKTEVLNFYNASSNDVLDTVPIMYGVPSDIAECSNIERIIYPNGDETRYRYKRQYFANADAKIMHGIYCVENSYDIIGGVTKNHKSYTFTSSSQKITKTETDSTKGTVSIHNYNTGGVLTQTTTSEDGTTSSKPYIVTTYTYNEDGMPETVKVNNSGMTTTTKYSYKSDYPSALLSEIVGDKKVTYTYHTIDDNLSGIPHITSYYYKDDGGTYVNDYSIETTLTSDNNAVEYVKVIQNETIKAQTMYSYYDDGRVKSITEWISSANSDGVLDENDNIVVTNCSYSDATNSTTVIESIDSVTDIDGTDTGTVSASYVYTPTGNISKMTDPNGNTTDVVYDAIGRATKYTYANGAIETVDYDAEKNFTNTTDKSGKSIWTYYDSYGNPTSKFFYDSGWKQYMGYSYDTSGRLNEQKSHRDSGKYTRETYTYDILDRPLKKTVYDGMTKLYTENYTYTISSSNLVVTKTTTAADGTAVATVKETYNKYGWLLSREISSDTETMTYSYTYDYKGRVLTETDANGGVITYEYNYDDSLNKIVYPDYSNEVFGYDLLGRNTVHFKRGLIPVRHTYDKLGRVIQTKQTMISSYSMTSKMYYDKNSNLIKESIRNNVQGDKGEETYTTTEYVYNNMNDMIGVIAADGTATQYWYDNASRVTAMKTGLSGINTSGSAPTGSIKYTYDTRGYLSKETDALGRQETYTHDYVGNVLTATDRNGAVTTNAYGSFGVTTSSVTDGTNTEKYTYTYNKVGHLTETKMYNNDTLKDTVTNVYDAFGRKTAETNGNYSNRYAYDLNSNVTNYQLLKSGIVENNVDYTYDEMNQLTGANFNGIIASYTYDSSGNIATKTVGNNITTIDYNNANLPISYETKAGDTVLNSYTYTYSLDGNRVTDIDSVNDVNKSYEYDAVGRLTKETQTGAINRVSEFTYDARGNRIRETITGSDSYIIESEYDNNNRITWQFGIVDGIENSCIQYTYDSNGNQTRKITYADEMTDETFTYNLQNQLTGYTDGTTTASYAYGANGLRKSKTVDTTTTGFVWNGSNLAAETYSNGNIEFMYQYGADGIVAREDYESLVTLYLKNAHGDVVGLTLEDGSVDSRYIYDAFGNQLDSSADINPFRYCGEYYDAETGLIYLRARYYDSANGRFISEDPIKDGLNWYSYCGGNPILYIDPFGLDSYIFYETGMKAGDGDHYFSDEAKIYRDELKEKYGEDHVVHLVSVSSAEDFEDYWNNDMSSDVDDVYLIFHGSVDYSDSSVGYMYFENKSRIYAKTPDSGLDSGNVVVSDLNAKDINKLTFSVCNSANPDAYNLTYAFMQQMKIDEIIGWDGGTVFNYDTKKLQPGAKGIKNQGTWYRLVEKDSHRYPKRKRYGKRRFINNGIWSEDNSVRNNIEERDRELLFTF